MLTKGKFDKFNNLSQIAKLKHSILSYNKFLVSPPVLSLSIVQSIPIQ